MESLLRYKCYEVGYAELFRKSDCSQEIPTPKKVLLLEKELFRRTAFLQKVHILNNYLF